MYTTPRQSFRAVGDRHGPLYPDGWPVCSTMIHLLFHKYYYYKFSKKTLSQVAIAASLVPARVIGLDNIMGSIEKNKLADFILLQKDNLEISETYIAGKSVYKSE